MRHIDDSSPLSIHRNYYIKQSDEAKITDNSLMETSSTYAALGIPEGIAAAFLLIWLSLSLAPWFGGTEIGPLKIPRLHVRVNRWMRVVAPFGFILFALGFLRIWPPPHSKVEAEISHDAFIANFFDSSKQEQLKGTLFILNELEAQEIQKKLGTTKWEGGPHWGQVSFDKTGRTATYTNELGRSAGRILIQGAPPGTVPLLIGEWHQEDGQGGRIALNIDLYDPNVMNLMWGPGLSVAGHWKRLP
jgi:hypothetical protein